MRWTAGEWTVDVIRLELASVKPDDTYGGNPGNGEHLRVKMHGFFVADVQSVNELQSVGVPVNDLKEA